MLRKQPLCRGSNNAALQKFGIKPDGIINFLSNEPPFKQVQADMRRVNNINFWRVCNKQPLSTS
jgi:hypothetical protein